MNAKTQAQLVRMALEKAADAGLRVWSITADGTSVNISTFTQLGCIFGTYVRLYGDHVQASIHHEITMST